MDPLRCCPACGQPGTLLVLGVRLDHPHHWRPWVTILTPLYLCDRCETLIEGESSPGKSDARAELRFRHPALAPAGGFLAMVRRTSAP